MEKIKNIIRQFVGKPASDNVVADYFTKLDQLVSANVLQHDDIEFIESRCNGGDSYANCNNGTALSLQADVISAISTKELITRTHGRVNSLFWKNFGQSQELEILFVSHDPDTRGHIYRVKHICDELNNRGLNAAWVALEDVAELKLLADTIRVLVLFRCELNSELEKFILNCRERGIRVIFDIDDMVFDVSLLQDKDIHFISELSADEQDSWYERFGNYRAAMSMADVVSVPTRSLHESATTVCQNCVVFPNSFDHINLDITSKILQSARASVINDDQIILGYASGTPTHEKDFVVIKSVLIRLLSEYSNLCIKVIGHLDCIDHIDFDQFRGRISKLEVLPHSALPYGLADFDINLIPLDRSRFTDSKSELKFFEPALLKIPSVAIANPVYSAVIEHGVNGYLADGDEAWLMALRNLIDSEDLRTQLGTMAYNTALDRYDINNIVASYMQNVIGFAISD